MRHNDCGVPYASEFYPRPVISTAPRVYGLHPVAACLNSFLMCVVLCGTLFQLFVMPSLLRDFGLRTAWLLLPIMLLQPLHEVLIHEPIHSHLLPKRRANEFCARMLSILHGLPFDAT